MTVDFWAGFVCGVLAGMVVMFFIAKSAVRSALNEHLGK